MSHIKWSEKVTSDSNYTFVPSSCSVLFKDLTKRDNIDFLGTHIDATINSWSFDNSKDDWITNKYLREYSYTNN